MERRKQTRDLTEKQAATTGPKSQGDWRKQALYNLPHTSEAAQERTSSSSGQDLKQDVGNVLADRRQQLRERRWKETRSGSGVVAASTENRTQRYRIQESKAESRHNDTNSNPHQLGERKGGFTGRMARRIGIGTEHDAGVHYDPDWRPSTEGLNNGTEWYVGSSPPEESE
jgi:hypothetical protein